MIETGDEKFPILSGDFDSPELTEKQRRLVDMLKALGKTALIVAKSKAPIKVEKVGGLQSFLYQVEKLRDANKIESPEQIEKLRDEVMYENTDEEIGNKTETYRFLLSYAHQNPIFKKLTDEVIAEQMALEAKRANNRAMSDMVSEKTYTDQGSSVPDEIGKN